MTDRQVGAAALNVDIHPVEAQERQVAASVLNVDVRVPQGVQYGSAVLSAEVTTNPARWLGSLGMMVDYVVSAVAVNAARWSGLAFEMGTASPLAYWSAGAFRSSGSNPVVWVTDHFEVAP